MFGSRLLRCFLLLAVLASGHSGILSAQAQQGEAVATHAEVTEPFDVRDKFRRSTPLSSFKNFMHYALLHDFEDAANYLNIRGLRIPPEEQMTDEEWAHQLFIVLDSLFAGTPDLSSEIQGSTQDGLPHNLDWIGDARIGNDYVELLMERVKLGDGQMVWLFAADTLQQLPELYSEYGQEGWERAIDERFGGFRILRIEVWMWAFFLGTFIVFYVIAKLFAILFFKAVSLKDQEYGEALRKLVNGPMVLLFATEGVRLCVQHISLNAALIQWLNVAPVSTLTYAWLASRIFQFIYIYNQRRLIRQERTVTVVLMRPALTVVRITWYISVVIYILSRAGFNVSTMLAGLGIGGMAIALASQDTLKNIFGSLMILADKPFSVGQFISSNGFKGFVEEIGIRSTKIRLRNGHQVSIPNDTISRAEIENIGRRPFIRFYSHITLPANTHPGKLKKAVELIREILEDHEGMSEQKPPFANVSNLDETGFKISISFWYFPPDYKSYRNYCEVFYLSLAEAFHEHEIRFATPARIAVPMQPSKK